MGVVPSAWFLIGRQRDEMQRAMRAEASADAGAVARVTAGPREGLRDRMESTVRHIMKNAGRVDFILFAPGGKGQDAFLFREGSRMKPLTPDTDAPAQPGGSLAEMESPYSGAPVLTCTLPLSTGGWVQVGLSRDHYEAALAGAVSRTMGLAGGGVAAGLALSLFFARRITRPLEQLGSLARGIAAGDLQQRVPVNRGAGEIQTLMHNLNGMAAQLEENQGRMLDYQRNLETANSRLARRIARKQVLAEISADFLRADTCAPDEIFVTALGRVAEQLGLEGACIFIRPPGQSGLLQKSWEWSCSRGPVCNIERIPEAGFPWAIAHVARHRVLTIPDTAALPKEARAERINLERLGICTAAGAALGTGIQPTAYLFLRGHQHARVWTDGEEQFLAVASGIFSNAIARRESAAERERLQAQLLQSQKMEAVGQLSGGIAHDFNNMLVPIIGYSDSILNQAPADAPWAGDLQEIKRAAESAASITRRLLTFSRKQITAKKEMDLNTHIESVHKMLSRLLGETVRLDMDLAPDLWSISADASQVDQCLVNLSVNARAAMPSSGGSIRISTRMVDSEDSSFEHPPGRKAQGLYVRLSVKDTGSGMDEATLSRIFEPFFSTKGQEGTGLGLSVVHGVIHDHGGWITVESRPGLGTTFHLWLPALHEPLPKPMDTGMATASRIPRGQGQTIMLIEDEPGVLAFVSSALKQNGYRMLTASSGAAARELFAAQHSSVDLVMSDVVLPDASGVELVEEFYAHTPGLRALLSSGYNDKQALLDLVEKRGLRFLHKPYTLLQLLEAVHEALHGTGQRAEVC